MKKADELSDSPERVSSISFQEKDWLPVIVPETVLNSLVYNGIHIKPYFVLNNKQESRIIPDLYHVGRNFYTYWFRTSFTLSPSTYDSIDAVNNYD